MNVLSKLAAACLWGGALVLGGCGDSPVETAAPTPPAVTVVSAATEAVTSGTNFLGRTEPVARVNLQARVAGYLEQRNFEEGAPVEAGNLLFVIEQAPYQAALAGAQAQLSGAEAALAKAQQDVNRLAPLRERGAVSETDFDAAQAALLAAEAEVQRAEATVQTARLDLNYTQIRAPMDGTMGEAQIDEGNLVGPEVGTLATLTQLDPINVGFDVAERDVLDYKERIAVGAPPEEVQMHLRLANGSVYDHPGEIDFLSDQVDLATGTVRLRAVFPNPDRLLIPGQFVTVLFQRAEAEEKLVVPQASIQEDQAGRFVLVVDDTDTVQVRRVITGQRTGTGWVVEEGLQSGERVIYQGLQRVRPEMKVQASEAELPRPVEG